jgi:hypothetical protein
VGVTVAEHLEMNGVSRGLGQCDPNEKPEPETFERHIKDIEDNFWNERFPVYTAWKRSWYEKYLRTGGFQMFTGFGINAFLKRNDIINWPVQGSAFHCLLWSIIRLVQRLRRNKMKSRVVGQIHDCAIADVHPRERDDYIHMARQIMTEEVRRYWEWIIVPLETETEICEVDASWHEKKVHIEQEGKWVLKP